MSWGRRRPVDQPLDSFIAYHRILFVALSILIVLTFCSAVSASCEDQYSGENSFLDDVTSEGYTSEFAGYKFKLDHLHYGAGGVVTGISLDVEWPNESVENVDVFYIYAQTSFNDNDLYVRLFGTDEHDEVAYADMFVYNDSIGDVKGPLLLTPIASYDAYGCVDKINLTVRNVNRRYMSDLWVTLTRETNGVCVEDTSLDYNIYNPIAPGGNVSRLFNVDVKTSGSITFKAVAHGTFDSCDYYSWCNGTRANCTEYHFTLSQPSCNPPTLGKPDFKTWDLQTYYNQFNRPNKTAFQFKNNGTLKAHNIETWLLPQTSGVSVAPSYITTSSVQPGNLSQPLVYNLNVNTNVNPLNLTAKSLWTDCYGYSGNRSILLNITNSGPGQTNLRIKSFTIKQV